MMKTTVTHLAIGEIMHYEDTGIRKADIARMTRKMAVITENFIKEHPTEWLSVPASLEYGAGRNHCITTETGGAYR